MQSFSDSLQASEETDISCQFMFLLVVTWLSCFLQHALLMGHVYLHSGENRRPPKCLLPAKNPLSEDANSRPRHPYDTRADHLAEQAGARRDVDYRRAETLCEGLCCCDGFH